MVSNSQLLMTVAYNCKIKPAPILGYTFPITSNACFNDCSLLSSKVAEILSLGNHWSKALFC